MAKERATNTLAEKLLAVARERSGVHHGQIGWLARLAPEHRGEVEAAREQWLAAGGPKSSITATALASSIVESMLALGYRMPDTDGVARWLTSRR